MLNKIKLYLKIYYVFRTKELQKRMVNKYDFLIYIFCDFIIQLAGVVFFSALFSNIPSIKGWTFAEVVLIYGLFQLSYGLFGFLFWPLYDFGYILVSGQFDGVLMRPINSVFQLLCRGTGDIGGLFLGGILMIYSLSKGVFEITLTNLVMLMIFLICNLLIYICLYVLVASSSFWMENASGSLTEILNLCSNFARYPLSIFSKAVKALLTWFIPLGFIGFYPASYLLKNQWSNYILFLPVIVMTLLTITTLVWKIGIKRYRGSGN